MRALFLFSFAMLALAVACDGPRTSISIVGAHATRTADQRVQVDVEIVADEGLGGNVGTYCIHATFEHQDAPVDECFHDLEDGDHKTITVTTDGAIPPGSKIDIRVRLAAVDDGRTLVAP